jgi:hypothetical protein
MLQIRKSAHKEIKQKDVKVTDQNQQISSPYSIPPTFATNLLNRQFNRDPQTKQSRPNKQDQYLS